jgi:hypothetical protein
MRSNAWGTQIDPRPLDPRPGGLVRGLSCSAGEAGPVVRYRAFWIVPDGISIALFICLVSPVTFVSQGIQPPLTYLPTVNSIHLISGF